MASYSGATGGNFKNFTQNQQLKCRAHYSDEDFVDELIEPKAKTALKGKKSKLVKELKAASPSRKRKVKE